MKMPGIYAVYAAALAVFGRTIAGVHLGLLAVNLVSTVLVFLLGRRLESAWVGLGAATLFAATTLNPMLLGLGAYAEHFVLAAVLAGSLVLLAATESRRLPLFVATGAWVGLAFVIKQSGGVFGLFAVFVIVHAGLRERAAPAAIAARIGALVGGALVPFLVVCAWLAAAGTFGTFWFWTFTYASTYGGLQNLDGATFNFVAAVDEIVPAAWPLLVLAVVGIAAAAWAETARRRRAVLWSLLSVSFIATSLGFYYRAQYFLLTVPALCLLAAVGTSALARGLARWHRALPAAAAATVVVAAVYPIVYHRALMFQASTVEVVRAIHDRNPFAEAVEIARYIRERSGKDDRIAVIGSEPQIYFYTRRPAATGYVYMYPLMETQPYAVSMQQEFIRELTAARPRYLVFVNVHASWLSSAASDRTLVRWFEGYWRDFERVGIADIVSRDVTRYRWDDAARDYAPESPLWVAVFRRRE
jgi:4-amino-4-deoxy-L-arabinose transferase-like glycosyltransferase